MRLGKKVKAGLKLGAKIGGGLLATAGVVGAGLFALGGKGSSTPSVPTSPSVPTPSVSETRKEINRLQALPEPTFRTPEQRASAIQSTDDFIAKYSKFYPDTRP